MDGSRHVDVPVEGGSLAVSVGGPNPSGAEEVVVLVHGITSNQKVWPLVESRLARTTAWVAVDLRGRGASSALPGPFGVMAHAADVLAVLDHLMVETAILVGHSMGAYIATAFGALYPERLAGTVLIDGGVAMRVPDRPSPDATLEAVMGPAVERLGLRFRTRGDYLSFWRPHPAFAEPGDWNETIAEFFANDLGGTAPNLISRVNPEAVAVDGADIFLDEATVRAGERLECPAELVLAERGLMGEAEPLVLRSAATSLLVANDQVRVSIVPSVNHYTVVLTPRGADAIAAAIGRLSGPRRVGP